ncbi:MAG: hypothetical protein ACRDGB_08985, partial [Candidatus Limnocylindria bacterium]
MRRCGRLPHSGMLQQVHRRRERSEPVGQLIGDTLPVVVTDRHAEIEVAQLVADAACDRALKL